MLPARELLPQEAASTLQGEGEGEGEERRGEGRDGEERRGEQAWESDGSTRPETSITMLRSDVLCFTFQYAALPTQWVVPMHTRNHGHGSHQFAACERHQGVSVCSCNRYVLQ